MEKNLAEAKAEEEAAVKEFDALVAAKTKEINALTSMIEEKTERLGALGVEVVEMMEDLEDTKQSLEDDKKFLVELQTGCSTKEAEWAERSKIRNEELVALADTIKILNDDDALELFKKTLPGSASFMQVESGVAQQALAIIKASQRAGRPELNFLALALQGKKVNFSKVLKMIDDMVANLKLEQNDDNDKKEYCNMQFDAADDKKKGLERSAANLGKAIAKGKEAIATLADEIKALEEGIVALDKSVAEATEQRKEENADYTELMSADAAAKELLGFAKNRLNKFYNPRLYKAAAVLADVSRHNSAKAAPPPPPATAAAYTKKSEESNGVIAMLDTMIGDLTKEMTEAKATESNAQSDYEQAMKDSAEKRAQDSKSLADKSKAKAQTQADVEAATEEKAATTKTLMATLEYIQSLHAECDWLLQYFEVRKEARTGEIESLKTAKSVLSGADFALVQTGRSLRGQA